MTPHQQRCETCNKDVDCPIMKLIATGINSDIPLMAAAIIITPETGCASHSSQQVEQDKVLDKLLARISDMEDGVQTNNMSFDDGRFCAYNFVRREIAELRSKGEQG